LSVDFTLEVKSTLLVGDITGGRNEGKANPKEKGVPSEEAAVVEQNASPANHGSEDSERRGDSGQDELSSIAYTNDVGMVPYVEPSKKAKNEGNESVDGQLCIECEWRRKGESRGKTYEDVGNEQNPFEPRPSWTSSCPGIFASETADIVFVVETRDSRFTTSESIDSTAEFWKAK
jgi:hypothetical protein